MRGRIDVAVADTEGRSIRISDILERSRKGRMRERKSAEERRDRREKKKGNEVRMRAESGRSE